MSGTNQLDRFWHFEASGLNLVGDRLQVVGVAPPRDPRLGIDRERSHDLKGEGLAPNAVVLDSFDHDGSTVGDKRLHVDPDASDAHGEFLRKFGPDGLDTSVHSSRAVDEHGVITEIADQLVQLGLCKGGKEITDYLLRRMAHGNPLFGPPGPLRLTQHPMLRRCFDGGPRRAPTDLVVVAGAAAGMHSAAVVFAAPVPRRPAMCRQCCGSGFVEVEVAHANGARPIFI